MTPVSYQLHLRLNTPGQLTVGRLGTFTLPAGRYVYTGSARRHLEARIARHLRRDKTLRWHIDHLLALPQAKVEHVSRSEMPECKLNQGVAGMIPIPGFGSSDCRAGCGSHLKYLGE